MIIIVNDNLCRLTVPENVDVPHKRLEDVIQFLQGRFLGSRYIHQQKNVLLLKPDGAIEVVEYKVYGHA